MALEEAPPFWWKKPGALAVLLSPLALVWGKAAALRMGLAPSASIDVPVLCVGNMIAGGAGKTPTCIALARAAIRRGSRPGFLSRGFGGRITGPHRVDPRRNRADAVGDEPLLLADVAETVISADRRAGAAMLFAQGCDLLLLDEGFQNPSLRKDFSIVVIDAKRGIGNGFSIPSGPLRAPVGAQLRHASAVLVIGDAPGGDFVIRQAARRGKPVFQGSIVADDPPELWQGKRVLAFAGIADPGKLHESLREAGVNVVVSRNFHDHHFYSDEEAQELLDLAAQHELQLVTTSKDLARLSGLGRFQEKLARQSTVFPIHLEFDDPRAADLILEATMKAAEQRLLTTPAA
jgi:tetraacyldisaccharide 4'-kinase